MRKTVKIDREEHQRLITAERVLSKEVKRLQDENRDLKNKGILDTSFIQKLSDQRTQLTEALQSYSRARSVRRKIWHSDGALMNKVSLRSRWPELYNVLDKELK